MFEARAMEQVYQTCQADVARVCLAGDSFPDVIIIERVVEWMLLDFSQIIELPPDAFIFQLAMQIPQEHDEQFVQHVNSWSREVLQGAEEEEHSAHAHVARRLMEVTPDDLQRQRDSLPFGCRNKCLVDAYQQGIVNPECRTSIQLLKQIRAANQWQHARQQEQLWTYGYVFVAFALCLVLLSTIQDKESRIIRAVYANAAIKASVEKELGETLGDDCCKGCCCCASSCCIQACNGCCCCVGPTGCCGCCCCGGSGNESERRSYQLNYECCCSCCGGLGCCCCNASKCGQSVGCCCQKEKNIYEAIPIQIV